MEWDEFWGKGKVAMGEKKWESEVVGVAHEASSPRLMEAMTGRGVDDAHKGRLA